MAFLKWIVLLPFQFLRSFAAWLVCPIAPLFAKNYSLKGTWFWWCTTPNTDLRGDQDHQKKYNYKNSYLQQVHWIFRNPAVKMILMRYRQSAMPDFAARATKEII